MDTLHNSNRYQPTHGFLAHAIDDLAYSDCLRSRCGVTPIATHCPTWRTTDVPAVKGAYLDRVLLHGARTLRAGCLAPWLCNIRTLDHALVVADIDYNPLPTVPEVEPSALAHPQATSIAKFLTLASTARDSPDPTAKDDFIQAVADNSPAESLAAALKIAAVAAGMASAGRANNSAAHTSSTTSLQELTQSFLSEVYYPIISAMAGKVSTAASGAPPSCFNPAQMGAIRKVKNEAAPVQRLRKRGTNDLYDLLLPLRSAWADLVKILPPNLTPSAEICNQVLLHPGQNSVTNTSMDDEIALCSSAVMKGLKVLGRQARKQRTTDWREVVTRSFQQGDLHKFFQRSLRVLAAPPSTSSVTVMVNGIPTIATTQEERAEGTRQVWSKLYEYDPWRAPACILQGRDGITGYKTAVLNSSPSPAQSAADPTLKDTINAFKRCSSDAMDWAAVTAPISDADFQHMIEARWGRAAGQSGMKICAMQFFPEPARKCLHSLLNVMWSLQIIPPLVKAAKLVLIPKPS